MSGRWTVSAGRNIHFDGKPFVSVDREGDTEPVEADGSVHLIVECLNQAGVTPDDIWERHMGHPRRRPKHARELRAVTPRPMRGDEEAVEGGWIRYFSNSALYETGWYWQSEAEPYWVGPFNSRERAIEDLQSSVPTRHAPRPARRPPARRR